MEKEEGKTTVIVVILEGGITINVQVQILK